MKITLIKKKFLKYFIILSVCISMWGGPAASNEINKILECLTGERDVIVRELNDEDDEAGEMKKHIKR